MTTLTEARGQRRAFRHEALLYASDQEFVQATGEFIRSGVESSEPVMVMVEPRKIDMLRSALGALAARVWFKDMTDIGRNPARIIPVWKSFLAQHGDGRRPARGIGEPVWPGRGPAELAECQLHEQLLNTALVDARAFRLVCPYDTADLNRDAIEGAYRSHPTVIEDGMSRPSRRCHRNGHGPEILDGTLPEPPSEPREVWFEKERLQELRSAIAREALGAGLGEADVDRLLVAANEAATNSVRHGGGEGSVRIWREDEAVVCEIRDDGHITDPLVGRLVPTPHDTSGRGLWLANQLCDLVQLRSSPSGTTVRLHLRA